jgi:hypothetical protein
MVQRLTQSITGAGIHIVDATAINQMVDLHSEMEGDPSGRLDILCGAITQQFESHCNRAFKGRVVTEYLNGSGRETIKLGLAPIGSVISLKYAATSSDLASETALTEGTDFDVDGDEGVIWLLSGYFYRGRGNVLVEYAAGYGSDSNELRLAQAAFVMQFNASWREWDKKLAGLSSQAYGDRSDSKITEPMSLLPEVKLMLQPLMRMGL